MASIRILAIFAFAVAGTIAIFSATTDAKEITVGDDDGWTLGFDYTSWAASKEFYVGDTLVFNYPAGYHNVYIANMTEFMSCSAPDNAVPLTSGNDKITLATPGNKWYFCLVGEHCANGQKLKITVMPSIAPTPSPAPSPESGW